MVRKIGEINPAQGKRGRFPFLLLLNGIYLFVRDCAAGPNGTTTRVVFLLLGPLSLLLAGLFLIPGRN
jgi:hypothetical protein